MTSVTIEVDEETLAELERLSQSGGGKGKTLAAARAVRALVEQSKQLDQFREDLIILRGTVVEALRLLEAGGGGPSSGGRDSAVTVLRLALESTRRSAVITVGAPPPPDACTHSRRQAAVELPAGCFSCLDCGSVFRVRASDGGDP